MTDVINLAESKYQYSVCYVAINQETLNLGGTQTYV